MVSKEPVCEAGIANDRGTIKVCFGRSWACQFSCGGSAAVADPGASEAAPAGVCGLLAE